MGIVTGITSFQYGIEIQSGYILESQSDNLVAHAGGGKASATPMTAEVSRVITVATSGDSVLMPPSQPGMTVFVINHGTNPMQVYGAGTDQIDDVATATGVSQMANSSVLYTCNTAGNWYTEGLASGFVRGYALQTFSSATIASSATNTQASGTPITTMLANVTGSANGSVLLPPSSVGMEITVHNTSGFVVSLFPNTGETINGGAANAALNLPAGTSTVATVTIVGAWLTVPRTPS